MFIHLTPVRRRDGMIKKVYEIRDRVQKSASAEEVAEFVGVPVAMEVDGAIGLRHASSHLWPTASHRLAVERELGPDEVRQHCERSQMSGGEGTRHSPDLRGKWWKNASLF
jgi:hypothetical protein